MAEEKLIIDGELNLRTDRADQQYEGFVRKVASRPAKAHLGTPGPDTFDYREPHEYQSIYRPASNARDNEGFVRRTVGPAGEGGGAAPPGFWGGAASSSGGGSGPSSWRDVEALGHGRIIRPRKDDEERFLGLSTVGLARYAGLGFMAQEVGRVAGAYTDMTRERRLAIDDSGRSDSMRAYRAERKFSDTLGSFPVVGPLAGIAAEFVTGWGEDAERNLARTERQEQLNAARMEREKYQRMTVRKGYVERGQGDYEQAVRGAEVERDTSLERARETYAKETALYGSGQVPDKVKADQQAVLKEINDQYALAVERIGQQYAAEFGRMGAEVGILRAAGRGDVRAAARGTIEADGTAAMARERDPMTRALLERMRDERLDAHDSTVRRTDAVADSVTGSTILGIQRRDQGDAFGALRADQAARRAGRIGTLGEGDPDRVRAERELNVRDYSEWRNMAKERQTMLATSELQTEAIVRRRAGDELGEMEYSQKARRRAAQGNKSADDPVWLKQSAELDQTDAFEREQWERDRGNRRRGMRDDLAVTGLQAERKPLSAEAESIYRRGTMSADILKRTDREAAELQLGITRNQLVSFQNQIQGGGSGVEVPAGSFAPGGTEGTGQKGADFQAAANLIADLLRQMDGKLRDINSAVGGNGVFE